MWSPWEGDRRSGSLHGGGGGRSLGWPTRVLTHRCGRGCLPGNEMPILRDLPGTLELAPWNCLSSAIPATTFERNMPQTPRAVPSLSALLPALWRSSGLPRHMECPLQGTHLSRGCLLGGPPLYVRGLAALALRKSVLCFGEPELASPSMRASQAWDFLPASCSADPGGWPAENEGPCARAT